MLSCGLVVLKKLSLQKIQIMNIKEILKKFNNRYIIATLIFAVIIIFVDQYNIFSQFSTLKKLKKAQDQVEYYENEIKEQQEVLDNLHRDSALMERIAREKYMMKRDNEVIYIIEAKE
jgi:cell division protein FtsB